MTSKELTKLKEDFDEISWNGIISQNKILEYFGFELYINTKAGDRLFGLFRSANSTPLLTEKSERFLDWHSFVTLMSIIKVGSSQEKAELVYGMFDQDKNNILEREEMIAFYSEFMKSLSSSKVSDPNTSELKSLISSTSSIEINHVVLNIVDDIFDKYAKVDSTKITAEELQKYLYENFLNPSHVPNQSN